MGNTGEIADQREELSPLAALGGEHVAAARGDAVIATAALVRTLNPPPLHQSALLELVERGVERGEVERQRAGGSFVDQLDQFVAVTRFVLEKREDDEL